MPTSVPLGLLELEQVKQEGTPAHLRYKRGILSFVGHV